MFHPLQIDTRSPKAPFFIAQGDIYLRKIFFDRKDIFESFGGVEDQRDNNVWRFFEVHGLSLTLGGTRILDNISFTLDKGEFLSIVGPNGAGKSSLLKCIGRLYREYTGSVMLDGMQLAAMPPRMIAQRIAWVHQTSSDLLPFTVREFASMSRYPWQKSFSGETSKDRETIDNALETAGISELADRQLDSLSGGERQRALIAAALAQSTDILYLDEPTSFLDYRHQAETLALIEKINKEQGITVIMVTHDINLALHGADNIIALKHGKVMWQGKSTDIINGDLLSEIFETEFCSFKSAGQEIPYVTPKGLVR